MRAMLASLGCVAMASAFAAEEPRLSGRPICIGTEVAPELIGTYIGMKGRMSVVFTLAEGSVTTIEGNCSPDNVKAWTCRRNGLQVLVMMKDERYLSRVILQGGEYLIVLGDVTPEQPLNQSQLQRLLAAEDSLVFKKQK